MTGPPRHPNASALDRLDARLTELGMAATHPALPVDATIKAGPRSTVGDAARLPRISIDERGGADAAVQPSSDGRHADLAIVATLGEGGMGRVRLAHQRSLGREVAVKTLHERAAPGAAEALLREARLTGSLEHPAIIPVHALGVDDHGRPLLVMKRIDGVEWRALLADPSHPAWATQSVGDGDRLGANLAIFARVCQALELAHSRGVIHRDIKPENVLLGAFGEIYLGDWGIATTRDDARRTLVGTPIYMAPEMALGEPVDERTDVYLLGATLHEVLTGRPRHDGTDVRAVLHAAAISAPYAYDANVPPRLADLCNRATARDPERRPPSARAFREELEDFVRQRGAETLAAAATERVRALEALLADAPDRVPADLPNAYRLSTEARFGFAQIAKEQPRSELARRGLERCLRALVDIELRQDHANTAAALLGEMTVPDEALAARLAAVRARLAERDRENERLRALERDLDPGVAVGPRRLALGALALAAIVSATALLMSEEGANPTHRGLLIVGALMVLIVLATLAATMRYMRANAFNRRLGVTLLVAASAAFFNRILGTIGGTAIVPVLTADLIIFAAVAATAAATLLPRLWMCATCCAGGAVVLQLWPQPVIVVPGTVVIATFLAIWALRGESRDPSRASSMLSPNR